MTNIKILKENILVSEIEAGEMHRNGIIIPDDNAKERGIRARWCKVFKVGPDITDIKKDDWILVDHGRWTYGFDAEFDGVEAEFRWVDYKDVMIVQSEKPDSIRTK